MLPDVRDLFGLDGKVAIITGAGRGLGVALARGIPGAGAVVCLADIDAESAIARAAEIEREGAPAVGLHVDVGDSDPVDRMISSALDRWGRSDILVNNEGILGPIGALETDDEAWDAVLRVNLRGPFACARSAARAMAPRGGAIVNVAATSSIRATRLSPIPSYDASKAGLAGLTRALAVEWAPFGIRVNAVAPGPLRTDRPIPLPPEQERVKLAAIPMGRRGLMEEVVSAVVFLASSAAAYVTGHVLAVDGGATA